jgi:hypothetical protein
VGGQPGFPAGRQDLQQTNLYCTGTSFLRVVPMASYGSGVFSRCPDRRYGPVVELLLFGRRWHRLCFRWSIVPSIAAVSW